MTSSCISAKKRKISQFLYGMFQSSCFKCILTLGGGKEFSFSPMKDGEVHTCSPWCRAVGGMPYLLGSQGEGDCGQGLEKLWSPPHRVLGVGAVHQAEELQHTGWECLFPGAIFRTCQGLKTQSMRHGAWQHDWGCLSQPDEQKSQEKTPFWRLSTRSTIVSHLRL